MGGAGPWGGALARGWGFVRGLKGLGPLRTELGESAVGLAMPVKGRWRRRGVGGVCVCVTDKRDEILEHGETETYTG